MIEVRQRRLHEHCKPICDSDDLKRDFSTMAYRYLFLGGLRLFDRFDGAQRTRLRYFSAQLPASRGGQYVRENHTQADGRQCPSQRRGRGASVARRTVLKSASKFTGQ